MDTNVVAETDPRVSHLKKRLVEFYATTDDYQDFQVNNHKPEFWNPIRDAVLDRLNRAPTCRVLEFGAGRTTFGDYLADVRSRVTFHVQDITPQNREHLATQADHVHIGEVTALDGTYDIIFSTFVWEHITNPREVLAHLLARLAPGGRLFIACPRYDMPFYVPPSARHYSKPSQLALSLRLWLRRARTALGGSASFAIHTDPALFHKNWYRDSDAIHWASIHDLRRALPPGYRFKRLHIPARGLKQRIWEQFLLLFVEITRQDEADKTGR